MGLLTIALEMLNLKGMRVFSFLFTLGGVFTEIEVIQRKVNPNIKLIIHGKYLRRGLNRG